MQVIDFIVEEQSENMRNHRKYAEILKLLSVKKSIRHLHEQILNCLFCSISHQKEKDIENITFLTCK